VINRTVHRALAVCVLSVFAAVQSMAQSSVTDWSVGAIFQVAPAPAPIESVGIELSRVVSQGKYVDVSFGASLMTAAARNADKVLVAALESARNSCCDIGEIAQSVEVKALMTVGLLERHASFVPRLFVGGGFYGTRWRGGKAPNSAAEASGAGPSGILLEGGLSWRLPLTSNHVTLDAMIRKYDRLFYGIGQAAFGVRLNYLF
jgi:hypothetical protein